MIRGRDKGVAIAAALALWAAGCGCLTAQEAAAKQARLDPVNRDRAEPAMRAAAAARGAVLLPVAAELIDLPGDCDGDESEPAPEVEPACRTSARQPHTCTVWTDNRFVVIRRQGQSPRLVVAVQTRDWKYARLARRGNTFIVLEPQISLHTVGAATFCACDAPYAVVVCSVPTTIRGFLIDEAVTPQIESLSVPITVDGYHWSCKRLGGV